MIKALISIQTPIQPPETEPGLIQVLQLIILPATPWLQTTLEHRTTARSIEIEQALLMDTHTARRSYISSLAGQ